MFKVVLAMIFATYAGIAQSAIDLPVDVLQSRQTLKGGAELFVSSDGARFDFIKLLFKGKAYLIKGNALLGLEQPDLASVRVKLVSANKCEPKLNSCFDYSIPLIDIAVAGIPEDQECLEGCSVRFLLKENRIYRKTGSQKRGATIYFSEQEFIGSD